MANIHAINAQGTEYGITAENGITQEQVDAIATIGDVADLETTEKTTLVGAINEVNRKIVTEQVIFENANPTDEQEEQTINVSGLANAKALKITHGMCSQQSGILKEEVFPLRAGVDNNFYLSQETIARNNTTKTVYYRRLALNASRGTITIDAGKSCILDMADQITQISTNTSASKVIKIVALF